MIIRHLAAFIALSALTAVAPKGADADERPNVLLIISDDTAYADLGPFGSALSTPALDEMARKGIKFSNFHATPVCSVTRSELITGAANIQVGLGSFDYSIYPPAANQPGYEGWLTDNALAISQLLQDNGYNTYKVGKWHLGGEKRGGKGPWEWGFTKSFGILSGGSNHWNDRAMLYDTTSEKNKKLFAEGKAPGVPKEPWHLNGKPYDRPTGIYSNEIYISQLINFINDDKDTDKPFFAWLAYTTGHIPLQAPRTRVNKHYDRILRLGYEGLKKDRFERLKKEGLIEKGASEAKPNQLAIMWDSLTEEQKMKEAKIMATYAAMFEDQDYHTGRLIDYLDMNGMLDNTLVIYVSDNGPEGFDPSSKFTGNPTVQRWFKANFDQSIEAVGGMDTFSYLGISWANAATGDLSWWKWFIGEGGIRTPAIIAPPGAYNGKYSRAGETSDATLSVRDLPMTILDYAGIEHPGSEYKGREVATPSGISARAYLEGEQQQVRTEDDMWAFELFGNQYVMSGRHKAIRVRKGMWGDGTWHLYDVVADPAETTPLEGSLGEKLKSMISFYDTYASTNNIVEVSEEWSPFSGIGK